MNYRTNEDKLCDNSYNNWNAIINVEDLSEDSGPVLEPATLQEVKDYLRLEGYDQPSTGISVQEPITLDLLAGQTTVTSPSLVNAVIIQLTREGTTYTQALATGNLKFTHDPETGTLAFNNAGNINGEEIGVSYGYANGGGSSEYFDFDDQLISDMIIEARMWVEKFTGIHCVPKRLQVVYCNGNGYLELPGPVTGTIDSIETLTLLGANFPKIKSPLTNEATITYPAGYDSGTAPAWVKNAIKAYVADHYEYRGDDAPPAANQRAAGICRPYRRVSVWA